MPKSRIVSTPRIKSYTGGETLAGTSMMSGFNFTNFEFENFGKITSSSPTFVVLKVPFDVLHFWGANRSFCGMYAFVLGCENNKSPSAPESSKTRQTLLAFLFLLPILVINMHSIVVHRPLPLTTLACIERIFFSTILSAIVLLGDSEKSVFGLTL